LIAAIDFRVTPFSPPFAIIYYYITFARLFSRHFRLSFATIDIAFRYCLRRDASAADAIFAFHAAISSADNIIDYCHYCNTLLIEAFRFARCHWWLPLIRQYAAIIASCQPLIDNIFEAAAIDDTLASILPHYARPLPFTDSHWYCYFLSRQSAISLSFFQRLSFDVLISLIADLQPYGHTPILSGHAFAAAASCRHCFRQIADFRCSPRHYGYAFDTLSPADLPSLIAAFRAMLIFWYW